MMRTTIVTLCMLLAGATLKAQITSTSDSTYIVVKWNRDSDKPHYGFLFHRQGCRYKPREGNFGNPFISRIELSDSSFELLRKALFSSQGSIVEDPKYRLYMAYWVGLISGEKLLSGRSLKTEGDYLAIYKTVSKLLQGTNYEGIFRSQWSAERVGLPISK